MSVTETIEQKLKAAFAPLELVIENDSQRHAGHLEMRRSGGAAGGETHFNIRILSAAFAGKSRIERHRMVNAVLADELAGPVHALAIKALAPGDPTA